jgi:predicted enzyme related to lactoylglutathione lyase
MRGPQATSPSSSAARAASAIPGRSAVGVRRAARRVGVLSRGGGALPTAPPPQPPRRSYDGPMERVTGLGGVFFRCRDPETLQAWYMEHLGLPKTPVEGDSTVVFRWRHHDDPDRPGATVWAPFADDTEYFGRPENPWMLNFRVRDLDAMLDQLRAAGAKVDEKVEAMEGFGRFGWFEDPEGNRIELWEPAEGM